MVYDDDATIAFKVAHTGPKRQVFLGPCQPVSPSDIQLVVGIVMVIISMVMNLMVRNQFPKAILNEGVVGFGTLKQSYHLPRFAQRQFGVSTACAFVADLKIQPTMKGSWVSFSYHSSPQILFKLSWHASLIRRRRV